MARKGSRAFRKRLRQLDEVLRSAANVTVTEDLLEGARATLEIRDLSKVNIAIHAFFAGCILILMLDKVPP